MMTFQKGDIIYKIDSVTKIIDSSVKYTIQSIMNEYFRDLSRDTALVLAENDTEPSIHVVQVNDTHYAIRVSDYKNQESSSINK